MKTKDYVICFLLIACICLSCVSIFFATSSRNNQGEIGAQGIQGLRGEKGEQGERGLDGKDGLNGRDGKDGKDGITVESARFDSAGNLIIGLSNGNEINAGNIAVVGPAGKDGKNGSNGKDGQNGKDGRGIVSIDKTATNANVDTYTIRYTDGTTSTFTVTNGRDGDSTKESSNTSAIAKTAQLLDIYKKLSWSDIGTTISKTYRVQQIPYLSNIPPCFDCSSLVFEYPYNNPNVYSGYEYCYGTLIVNDKYFIEKISITYADGTNQNIYSPDPGYEIELKRPTDTKLTSNAEGYIKSIVTIYY